MPSQEVPAIIGQESTTTLTSEQPAKEENILEQKPKEIAAAVEEKTAATESVTTEAVTTEADTTHQNEK